MIELRADPQRRALIETGIYVRARWHNGVWGDVDIAHLDRPSLVAWLRKGDARLAERVLLHVLGHMTTETTDEKGATT